MSNPGALAEVYKVLKKYHILGNSRKKNAFGMHPLVMSTSFIFTIELLAIVARRIVNNSMKYGVLKQMLLEFIATAELCAACFELIIVADNYGVWAYALGLFLLTIMWSKEWENATACPYNPIEEVLQGTQYLTTAFMLILAQVIGGLLVFRPVQLFWAMELVETHKGRAYEDCTADLQVGMILGCLIEGMLTCFCRLVSRGLNDANIRGATFFDAFFSTLMVVVAFNFSGGYFNPALATSLKYGCKGNTFAEHMAVYWAGAIAGSVISVFIYRTEPIQRILRGWVRKVD